MDLELSEEEAALRDNVRAVLAGISPPAVARAVHDGGVADPSVWRRMVELGWPALGIDEAHGGLGLGPVELVLVAEELGRAAAPTPWLATATQFAPAVTGAFLERVASGEITGTLALTDGATPVVARPDGDGWVLDGQKRTVVDGATADEVVVTAGAAAFVVPGNAVVATPRATLDPTLPIADLRLDGIVVGPDRVLDIAVVHDAVQQATTAVAAMTVGACRKLFETTVEYAKVREQYGRPIGSFQAIKHRIVELYLSVERATALVYYAALAIAEDAPDRAVATSAAKAAAGDCQRLLAEDALQLHGGVGYTWEHDLHLWLKRAKAGEALFGGAVAHRARLAELVGVGVGVAG
jgi:alkylation response protein AidB-like acyl-CoA dehydrogenase